MLHVKQVPDVALLLQGRYPISMGSSQMTLRSRLP